MPKSFYLSLVGLLAIVIAVVLRFRDQQTAQKPSVPEVTCNTEPEVTCNTEQDIGNIKTYEYHDKVRVCIDTSEGPKWIKAVVAYPVQELIWRGTGK